MKKLLLIITVLLTGAFIVNAQNQNPAVDTMLTVGYTYYDLQTNASMPRRIINHPDGTVSFVWTYSNNATTGWPNRGTGYNYWNGTALKYPSGPIARIEGARTGWPNLGVLRGGNAQHEVVVAHTRTEPPNQYYDYYTSTNTTKGSASWTSLIAGATLQASSVPGFRGTNGGTSATLWGRIAIGGADTNTIHLIGAYDPCITKPCPTPPDGPKIKGILAPQVYSRSTDGGASWDLQSILLPDYDSTRTLGGNNDTYDIDARGATAAIVSGGLGEDITLWKSTNNGSTWIRTFIDSSFFAPSFDSTSIALDSMKTNDGSVSVVVDTNNTVHVAYATLQLLKNATNDTTWVTFGDHGLVYWNDVIKQKVDVPILENEIDAVANGGNGNGLYEVARYTTSYRNTPPYGARYGTGALLSKPSIAVDGNNIFIVFSLPGDADSTLTSTSTDPNFATSYRDIWVIASTDGGLTWGPVQNITCAALAGGEENAFASLAKLVDTDLHILYQMDYRPGTCLTNTNSTYSNNDRNEMRYIKVNKAAVLAGTATCNGFSAYGAGIAEQSTQVFNVANNYPNPTSGLTNFDVSMKQNANIVLSLYNSLGQQISTADYNLSIGKHTLTANAGGFSSGLYFYTIKSGNDFIGGKFIKE
ncbi:MAG: T9SS type A sorting domain-containing protein [Bacteroidetes bacterium]|nr:T9SS type A sorting domain-containing protein [Bacteroidota bacterium]